MKHVPKPEDMIQQNSSVPKSRLLKAPRQREQISGGGESRRMTGDRTPGKCLRGAEEGKRLPSWHLGKVWRLGFGQREDLIDGMGLMKAATTIIGFSSWCTLSPIKKRRGPASLQAWCMVHREQHRLPGAAECPASKGLTGRILLLVLREFGPIMGPFHFGPTRMGPIFTELDPIEPDRCRQSACSDYFSYEFSI